MKRLILTLATALFVSASMFAVTNLPTATNWEGRISANKLSEYLRLTSSQSEEVSNICDYFNEQMTMVNNSSSKDQKAKLHNAIYGNLNLMRKTLDKAQYAKYAALMNVTLRNKGITLEDK
ncbi:MAG: hypothetical protein M0P00_07775 [Bacteroidaceae bacterium]|nr:hypothetical protein [Bacteroidaceae bacterium]